MLSSTQKAHGTAPPRNVTKAFRRIVIASLLIGVTSIVGGQARADSDKIVAVMSAGLRALDPIITTSNTPRNHGYMIYDVLVAVDENLKPQPQMADWAISADQRTYTFTLREGLLWHDEKPVTAADAVASLRRWGQRDGGGQLIFDITESLEAADARTIVWKLRRPFPAFLDTIAKQSALPAFMMPERIAKTPANTAITEYIGSGPFIFVKDEYQPNVRVVYKKFEKYIARKEKASWMAGGKVAKVSRVEWVTMPDAQTAINAIISGEVDYLEQVQIDLMPILTSSPDVVVETRDPLGFQAMARMNFKYPPFDNVKVRRAAMMALSQRDILTALVNNPDYFKLCGAIFGCATPYADESGTSILVPGGDKAAARTLLKESGYDGTPIVLLQPTDVITLKTQPIVAAQALREVGFNVDLQAMDWETLTTRRASQNAPSKGGWNLFFSNWMVPEIMSPLANPMINARGDNAWFGWPKDDVLEGLRSEYTAATTSEQQIAVARRIQAYTIDNVIYVPLGQFTLPQARSKALTGMIRSPVPVFWNVEKSK